jgi:hypothetical protein
MDAPKFPIRFRLEAALSCTTMNRKRAEDEDTISPKETE